MIVSLNWIKQYVDIDMPIDKLTELIGARLVEIEEVIDISARYQGIVTVKVVSVNKHPNADKLNVCLVDDGGKTKGVERDENKLIQIVCGAPNVREGMIAAWVTPGAVVPMTAEDDEPFAIGAKELRGVKSNGMLASAKELAIGDDHEGLLELNDAKLGVDFAHMYELNDYLIDIENKSLTHRPDCFGVIGLAREIAALTGKKFQSPDWLLDTKPKFSEGIDKAPKVTIEDPKLCSRYQAIVLEGADQNAKSPVLVQSYLSRVGVKPINAIVDITNYLMLVTGQPTHAFDYDKFVKLAGQKAEISVRAGKKGEKLALLDGRTANLTDQDIVIAAGKTPVALAGAMGGSSTAIDAGTKNILIESASFDLYKLRGTQMRHGIFTDSITRFTKGQSPLQTAPVLAEAVGMLVELTKAKPASKLADSYPKKLGTVNLEVSPKNISDILGKTYTKEDVSKTLSNVEFLVKSKGDNIEVEVPYWRGDIHILEDIADEVGRINGFDEISPSLPNRDFKASYPSELEKLKQKVRLLLARLGANDVLTYSFVHGDLLQAVGQKPSDSYAIVNAISPRLQYYRQSITPSLLELVHPNIKAGFSNLALFEINKTHLKSKKQDDGLPVEFERLGFVYAANEKAAKKLQGSPYYFAKHYLDVLCSQLGIDNLEYKENKNSTDSNSVYFAKGLSAEVYIEGELIGRIGEYKTSCLKALKLPQFSAGFEISIDTLLGYVPRSSYKYSSLSKYPGTSQDITLEVKQDIAFAKVLQTLQEITDSSDIQIEVLPVGIYTPQKGTTKNMTFTIQLTNHRATITREQANSYVGDITKKTCKKLQAKLV